MTDTVAKKLTRKERDRERHRREILDAAERVFIDKGYHLATVEEIAKEAEFSAGSIYNFFENKEDLYNNVIEKIVRDFMQLFKEQILTEEDPEEAIGKLLELRLTHLEEHRGFFRVFLAASPGNRFDPATALPDSCATLHDDYVNAVKNIFEKGIAGGVFAMADSLYLTLALEGCMNAFAAYWACHEPSESLAERVNKARETFLRQMCVGEQGRQDRAKSRKTHDKS